jgi:hypothetical protein
MLLQWTGCRQKRTQRVDNVRPRQPTFGVTSVLAPRRAFRWLESPDQSYALDLMSRFLGMPRVAPTRASNALAAAVSRRRKKRARPKVEKSADERDHHRNKGWLRVVAPMHDHVGDDKTIPTPIHEATM